MQSLVTKRKPSALMDTFLQLGMIYLTGGLAASLVTWSLRPLLMTGVSTGILYKLFKKLDGMTPGNVP